MTGGYIKLHRSMRGWRWYSNPNTKAVFLEILLTANFKDSFFEGVEVKKGEAVFTVKGLGERLGLSEGAVRTALGHLKTTNEITIKTTNRFSVATVENWGRYQGALETNNKQNNNQNNKQTTNKQQTNNNQTATSKNGEERTIMISKDKKDAREGSRQEQARFTGTQISGEERKRRLEAMREEFRKANENHSKWQVRE